MLRADNIMLIKSGEERTEEEKLRDEIEILKAKNHNLAAENKFMRRIIKKQDEKTGYEPPVWMKEDEEEE